MFLLQVAQKGAGLTARLQLLAAAVHAAEGAVRPRSQAEAAARVVDGLVPLLDRQLLQGGSTGRVPPGAIAVPSAQSARTHAIRRNGV